MKQLLAKLAIPLLLLMPITQAFAQFSSVFGPGKSIIEQQKDALKKSEATLLHLYKTQPSAKAVVDHAVGYATFSNFGMKILIAGGGTGSGVVFSKEFKKPIYMNMAEIQAGLGFGIKSFENIFVFETTAALNDFVNSGWTFGGQTTLAAKYEKNGDAYEGSVVVAPGILMYQLTDSGLAAEITGKGTKYYKNTDLNK